MSSTASTSGGGCEVADKIRVHNPELLADLLGAEDEASASEAASTAHSHARCAAGGIGSGFDRDARGDGAVTVTSHGASLLADLCDEPSHNITAHLPASASASTSLAHMPTQRTNAISMTKSRACKSKSKSSCSAAHKRMPSDAALSRVASILDCSGEAGAQGGDKGAGAVAGVGSRMRSSQSMSQQQPQAHFVLPREQESLGSGTAAGTASRRSKFSERLRNAQYFGSAGEPTDK